MSKPKPDGKYDLVLSSFDLFKKIGTIRILRDVLPDFGLKQALDFITNEKLPAALLKDVDYNTARRAQAKLKKVDAKSTVKLSPPVGAESCCGAGPFQD